MASPSEHPSKRRRHCAFSSAASRDDKYAALHTSAADRISATAEAERASLSGQTGAERSAVIDPPHPPAAATHPPNPNPASLSIPLSGPTHTQKRDRPGQLDPTVPSAPRPPKQHLEGHTASATCFAVLPDSHLIATACADGYVRVFKPDGRAVCPPIKAHCRGVSSLSALGGDVIVSYSSKVPDVATWRASTGKLVERRRFKGRYRLFFKIMRVSATCFAAAAYNGFVVFISHEGGRKLHVTAADDCVPSPVPRARLCDISVAAGGAIAVSWNTPMVGFLSGSADKTIPGLAVRGERVLSAAGCEEYIAAGSRLGAVSVYHNREGYPPVRWHKGTHSKPVKLVAFIGRHWLMSASPAEKLGLSRICFTPLPAGEPLFLCVFLFDILAIAVTADGRLAVVGEGRRRQRAAILNAPSALSPALKAHAALLFGLPAVPPSIAAPTIAAPAGDAAPAAALAPLEAASPFTTAIPIMTVPPGAIAPTEAAFEAPIGVGVAVAEGCGKGYGGGGAGGAGADSDQGNRSGESGVDDGGTAGLEDGGIFSDGTGSCGGQDFGKRNVMPVVFNGDRFGGNSGEAGGRAQVTVRSGDGGGGGMGGVTVFGSTRVSVERDDAQSLLSDLAAEHRSLQHLKTLSTKTAVLESMTVEALSEVVAGAMIGFQDEFLPHFPVLAASIRSAFRMNGVAGDMIVSFPVAKLLRNIVDTLHKNTDYLNFDKTVVGSFEWRLGRFLHDLRSK